MAYNDNGHENLQNMKAMPELENVATVYGTRVPRDASVDPNKNRIIFQTPHVQLDVSANPQSQEDSVFHIGGLDDPYLVVPLGADVSVTLYNTDSHKSHGWRLLDQDPPLVGDLKDIPEAFSGSEINAVDFSDNVSPKSTQFRADTPGLYMYVCPVPHHTKTGLFGVMEVSRSGM